MILSENKIKMKKENSTRSLGKVFFFSQQGRPYLLAPGRDAARAIKINFRKTSTKRGGRGKKKKNRRAARKTRGGTRLGTRRGTCPDRSKSSTESRVCVRFPYFNRSFCAPGTYGNTFCTRFLAAEQPTPRIRDESDLSTLSRL